MRLSINEICTATGGRLLWGDGSAGVTHFITDSREAAPGAMFVPVRGERVDGHAYIPAVFETEGTASFTDHEVPQASHPVVLVEDCRAALQQAAAYYRSRFEIPVVGVTGSIGKTTAKEMIAQALTAGFKVLKTEKNRNSQVGVPITICGLEPQHTAAVVEMGISMPREMERLAAVARPTCAVMTNIGVSHLEYLGSRENILREKAHIADYIPYGGVLFVNGDDELLSALEDTAACQVVTFGLGRDCYWQARDLREMNGCTYFTCLAPQGWEVETFVPALGRHNVRNALAAIAVACHLGIPGEAASDAIAAYEPPARRQQIKEKDGLLIIDDSYNASPESMRSALDILSTRPCTGKRIAVLADMLELGAISKQEHIEVGRYAREKGIDELVAVGTQAGDMAASFGSAAMWYPTNAEAIAFLKASLVPGDVVLVKGSRGMQTEEIVKAICGE